jgi:protein involved in polysaccharide export with SLBB domain
MKTYLIALVGAAIAACHPWISAQALSPGDTVEVKLRGVPAEEQAQVNGNYVVGASGGVRIPGLSQSVPAQGINSEQLARSIESAYIREGIYVKPAIEVIAKTGKAKTDEISFVNVGGQVRKTGNVPFRQKMTLMQAVQEAGDRTEFGGRSIELRRDGKLYQLDYREEDVKNLELRPNDIINVKEKGPFEPRSN